MAPFGFLLVIFIIHSCVGEDLEIKGNVNIVAEEGLVQSIEKLEPYWKSLGKDWVAMPDGDGYVRFSIEDFSVDPGRTLDFSDMDEKVQFYFYSRENPNGIPFNLGSLKNLPLNPTLSTTIICHGWMSNSTSSTVQSIKDALLARNDHNVIAVDWQYFADNVVYVLAVAAVKPVGEHVGNMIDELVKNKNINYEDIHLVGHSLGAHVSGFAGNFTGAKIGRISGLDPALPGFGFIADKDGKLDATDAKFVDVIHTCAGLFGQISPVGHIDFYPNGGSTFQPGCPNGGILLGATEACSHARSHQFFAESINNEPKFIAIRCKDWDHFKMRDCENVYDIMGQHVSKNLTGIFYLKTNEKHPFAMGIDGTIY